MALRDEGFLNARRLMDGPWQAFERDVARLLLANGFVDVRIVGGSGDRGADVLGVKDGELVVVQCKHTTSSPPPRAAVAEVVAAGEAYQAKRLIVAVSRPPTEGFLEEVERFALLGTAIDVATPRVLLDLMADTPEYCPGRRELRSYQDDAVVRMRNSLVETGRGQLVLATGLGKTVVMAEVIASLGRDGKLPYDRALILAHTRELVEQLHRSFWLQLPKWIATQHFVGGEIPAYWDGVVFATIQSVFSRIDKLPRFGLILVDEAHHIGAATFQRVLQDMKPEMLGGVTATPWRGDGYDIDTVLGQPLVKLGIADGLKQGFLADVDYRMCADNLDWKFVQEASRHKYSVTQLNRRLILPTRDDEAARWIRDVFDREERRSGLVFCPTLVHSHEMAASLRTYGFRCEAINGEMEPRQRELLLARFRAGELDVLTSVDLFNEGVDVPDVDLIVFMRATHSRRIFVQQLGRGLRYSPTKDRVVVLDFVTDLRRVAEVVELDRAVRDSPVEHLGLGDRLISFRDASSGGFLREWMLDQASLVLREGDPELGIPKFDFPEPPAPGGVQ